MKSKYFPIKLIFIIFTLLFFIGGVIMVLYGGNRIYQTYNLMKTGQVEQAIVKRLNYRHKAFEKTIWFSMDNNNQYRIVLFKLFSSGIKINDRVDVIFNAKRNFYIFQQYPYASLVYYIAMVILALVLIYCAFICYKVCSHYVRW
jgi:hypothetical protein